MSVLIVGSLAYDNVKTPHGEVEDAVGGSAMYASLAASIFSPTRIVGIVGEDFTPQLDLLSEKSIDTKGVQIIKDGKTFRWDGYYEGDMSQAVTTSTCLNVFEFFKPELPEEYHSSEFVLLGNIQPELQLHVLDQIRNPKLVATDTMNLWITTVPEKVKEVFERTDIVLINDAEARMLCDTHNLPRAAKEILSWGPKWVIVKKGEHGCCLFGNGSFFSCPALPLIEVKDPTGAGDSFAGGLIGWLATSEALNELTIRKAIVVGTAIAAYNVQNFSIENLKGLNKRDVLSRCREIVDYVKIPEIEL